MKLLIEKGIEKINELNIELHGFIDNAIINKATFDISISEDVKLIRKKIYEIENWTDAIMDELRIMDK